MSHLTAVVAAAALVVSVAGAAAAAPIFLGPVQEPSPTGH